MAHHKEFQKYHIESIHVNDMYTEVNNISYAKPFQIQDNRYDTY